MATTITYETLADIADEAGIDRDNIRTDYSGRGMYGSRCVAFDLDSTGQLLDLGAAIATVGGSELIDLFTGRTSTDGMGYGIVAYWPGITCEDAPEPIDPWDDYEDDDSDDDS